MVSFCGQGSLGGGGVIWFLLFCDGGRDSYGGRYRGIGDFPGQEEDV
jgi:hypothetical protein